ncbi:MAG: hypothetical protein AAGF32_10075 [Pseudomonadota bacterium]
MAFSSATRQQRTVINAATGAVFAALACVATASPANALEFLFETDGLTREAERKCDSIVAIDKYKAGRTEDEYYLVKIPAQYKYVTRKVMVAPPRKVYRFVRGEVIYDKWTKQPVDEIQGRRELVSVEPAKFKTITERVLVAPARYRAEVEHGRHAYVKERAVTEWRQGGYAYKCARRNEAHHDPHK